MLRIIAGEFRSRRLKAPEGTDVTRPMANFAKESVFNLLRGWFEDANVLDLFAGVGTMGLEAVSRGAKKVLMVEQNRGIFRLLEENIEALGCGDRATAVHGDALSPTILARAPAPVDVAFIDPPYDMMQDDRARAAIFAQVQALRSVLAEKSFVVLRAPKIRDQVDLKVDGFEGPETHRYGNEMFVHLYMPITSESPPSSARS